MGEGALQAMYNNTLASRKSVFDTQRYAWQKYVAEDSF
jgi:glucan 1,3-beta-glucosidase